MNPEIPAVVIEAIQRKFFPDLEQIAKTLRELKYDSIMGCWYFWHAGMYHGVETDGYIHT